MVAFSTVNAGDEVLAEHITELQGSLTGEVGQGRQILLTDFSSASNESLVIQNLLGRQVNVKAANGNSLLKVWDTTTSILSADGTKGITVSDAGVVIVGGSAATQQSLVSDDTTKSITTNNSGTNVVGPLTVTTTLGISGAATAASLATTGPISTNSTISGASLALTGALTAATGTFSGATSASLAAVGVGSNSAPSMYFTGTTTGWYQFSSGIMGLASGGSSVDQILMGEGLAATGNGMVTVALNSFSAPTAFLAAAGSSGSGVRADSDAGLIGSAIYADMLAGATVLAGKFTNYAIAGSAGFAIGVQGAAWGKIGYTGSSAGGVIGGKFVASSEVGASSQVLTGLQVNADALSYNADLAHACEMNIGTDISAPSARIWLVLSGKAASQSRAASGTQDAFISMSRKPKGSTAAGDDFTERARVNYGIIMTNGYNSTVETEGAGSFPFHSGSTFVSAGGAAAAGRTNEMLNGIDFSNITFSGHPFKTDNFAVEQTGFVGIGIDSAGYPLDILTTATHFMRLDAGTTNFIVGTAGAATGTYLRFLVGGTTYKIALLADA